MEEKARVELLKSVYEQHWLHARHVENERLWFTNIFALIVAGLLAFLGTTEDKELLPQFAIYVGYFIFILSLLGYFVCLTWRAPFVEHTTLANKLLEDSQLKKYIPYTSKAYRRIKIGWITAHELFLYFYALMASGGLFLLLYAGLEKPYWWISIILFFILCVSWRGLQVYWNVLKAPWKVLQVGFRGLKVLRKGRLRAIRLGFKASRRVGVVGSSWRGLRRREVDYRNEMDVQER